MVNERISERVFVNHETLLASLGMRLMTTLF